MLKKAYCCKIILILQAQFTFKVEMKVLSKKLGQKIKNLVHQCVLVGIQFNFKLQKTQIQRFKPKDVYDFTNKQFKYRVLIDNLLIENFKEFPYDNPVCLKKEGIRFIGFNVISSKMKKNLIF